MQQQETPDQVGLGRIAKGGVMVLAGNISNIFLSLIFNILMIRYITQSEFGFFSLCLAIVSILAVFAGLGFRQALPSYISYQLGKNGYSKAWGSIVSSFIITLFLGLFLAFLLFIKADMIALILHKPRLTEVIKILAFTLPLIALNNLLISHLRAIQDTKGKVYLQFLLRPFTGIMLVLLAIVVGLSFKWVLWAYTMSFLVTFVALFIYAKKKLLEVISAHKYSPVTKEVLLFSLPLLGTGMLAMTLTWTDTLMLGYFESAKAVGLYNGALRVARLIPILLTSAGFIYLPVASRLFSQNDMENVKKIYATLTKWVFITTLPFFLFIFLAPDLVLGLLFGSEYMAAGLALQFLALGFFTHVLFGLNAMTSISLGKPKINLLCLSVAFVVNVILDCIFRCSEVHPFSRSYLRIISFVAVITIILSLLPVRQYFNHELFFVFFLLVISVAGVIITKSITEKDVFIIEAIERKVTRSTFIADKIAKFAGS
jgi:O-antigen/teichoic acid export membrane protein